MNQQGFNRGYNRSFRGNNFNLRPSNTYVRRENLPRDNPDLSGLNDAQKHLVKEAAEDFAKQLLASSNSDSGLVATPAVREPVRPMPPVNRQHM
jgi:hypothetical protein